MIEGRRINLRPAREEELEKLYELENSVSNRGSLGPLGMKSFFQYKQDFEKYGWWCDDGGGLVIADKRGNPIGNIGCRQNGVVSGYEVCYQIFREKDRGQGYMTEALELFTAYMFAWKNIPRLYLFIIPENTSSIRLAEKIGYTKEGVMRRAIFVRGASRAFAIYTILREDGKPIDDLLRR